MSSHLLAYCHPAHFAQLLAPSIGNIHGRYINPPDFKLELLDELQKEVGPGTDANALLVLHGTDDLPDELFRDCLCRGAVKMNVNSWARDPQVKYWCVATTMWMHVACSLFMISLMTPVPFPFFYSPSLSGPPTSKSRVCPSSTTGACRRSLQPARDSCTCSKALERPTRSWSLYDLIYLFFSNYIACSYMHPAHIDQISYVKMQSIASLIGSATALRLQRHMIQFREGGSGEESTRRCGVQRGRTKKRSAHALTSLSGLS
jgi:hypothetical protein